MFLEHSAIRNTVKAAAIAAALLTGGLLTAGAAAAQSAPDASAALPGGANSITETYGDWSVACAVQNGQKSCRLTQQQFDSNTRQQVVAIELVATPGSDKTAGVLVLPFGLALDQGAALQIDDGTTQPALPFRTCLPAGCLIPVAFDAKQVALLQKGTALKIKAKAAADGKETVFRISLDGFGPGRDRAFALAK